MYITQVMSGAHLHVRSVPADVPLFRISEMLGQMALEFGMCFEIS